MRIIYEGVEINIQVSECKITDNMGGKADSLAISFADIKQECREWDFAKDNTIELIENPFSTGVMYVDGFSSGRGTYTVKALSLRKISKTKKTRIWEKVSFLDLVKDIAEDEEMFLETYGVENFQYERVEQLQMNNMEFLNYRCMLEGYNLKINNGKILIISEKFLMEQSQVLNLNPSDFIGNYTFDCTSNHIYSGCEVGSFQEDFLNGHCNLKNKYGEILKITNITLNSLGEANRFSKNILNSFNKYEITGVFSITINTNIAAGNSIKIQGLGSFNGIYVIEKITHDLIGGKSRILVRKFMEEQYE